MSGLKTLVSACVFAGSLAPQARADAHDLAVTMAGCAGRYSAEVEHAWLMQDTRSATVEKQRENFVALLDAMTTRTARQELLHHRIDAKHAQANLLKLATFGTNPIQAAWARQQSQYYKDRCASLLLDS